MPPIEFSEVFDPEAVSRHPDSEATKFRDYLSEYLGVASGNILAGNGSVELIRLIALTYFKPRDSILILEPTFGEYRVASQIAGAVVTGQWGREEDNFIHNIEETVILIKQSNPKAVFICNPNNPTGQYLSRQDIEMISNACEDTLLILDEAYISFLERSWPSLDLIEKGNLIIVRSMTKDYALAGLRLGYVVTNSDIIGALHRVLSPWNVNAVAQKAGIVALQNSKHLEISKKELEKSKQFLISEFRRLDFNLIPSETNFFLVKVPNSGEFRTALLKKKILVRDCNSFGLPGYIRIGTRTMSECQKLIEAMKDE